ncbi:3606_t:CDS:2 [Gigaspora rosea]|nr:3606_t:CDS:2 [Gigaspora rosea]
MRKIHRRSRFSNLEFVACVVTICCCFWPWIIEAQNVTDNINSNVNSDNTTNVIHKSTYSSAITLIDVLFAAVLVTTGAFICFTYVKFVRMAGSIVGFYTLGCLTWIAMMNSNLGYSDYRNLMIPTIIGSLGAMFFLYFNRMNVYFVGILGGCAFGLTTLSIRDNGLFESSLFRLVYLVIFGLIGYGIICFYCPTKRIWPLCLSSALCGSYSIILGVDQMLRSGFTTAIIIYLDLNQSDANLLKYSVSGKIYGLLGGVFVLAAIGFFIQLKVLLPTMSPGQTSGNGPPAMRDDLEKIVYEMNPSIRQSIRSSKVDFRDMNQLVTANNSYSEKRDVEGPEIVNNARNIENDRVKLSKFDHSNSNYLRPNSAQIIEKDSNIGRYSIEIQKGNENECDGLIICLFRNR